MFSFLFHSQLEFNVKKVNIQLKKIVIIVKEDVKNVKMMILHVLNIKNHIIMNIIMILKIMKYYFIMKKKNVIQNVKHVNINQIGVIIVKIIMKL